MFPHCHKTLLRVEQTRHQEALTAGLSPIFLTIIIKGERHEYSSRVYPVPDGQQRYWDAQQWTQNPA